MNEINSNVIVIGCSVVKDMYPRYACSLCCIHNGNNKLSHLNTLQTPRHPFSSNPLAAHFFFPHLFTGIPWSSLFNSWLFRIQSYIAFHYTDNVIE